MVTREEVKETERMVDKFVKEMDELKYNIIQKEIQKRLKKEEKNT